MEKNPQILKLLNLNEKTRVNKDGSAWLPSPETRAGSAENFKCQKLVDLGSGGDSCDVLLPNFPSWRSKPRCPFGLPAACQNTRRWGGWVVLVLSARLHYRHQEAVVLLTSAGWAWLVVGGGAGGRQLLLLLSQATSFQPC